MQTYTVSLFGHRRIDKFHKLDGILEKTVKELISSNEFVEFLIGRNGDFDEYAASVIKRVQKCMGKERCALTLVLPYTVTDIEYYQDYYDSVIIPEELYGVYPKSAIAKRNKFMVDRSDLVVIWCERGSGGAYEAEKYARVQGKRVLSLSIIDN